MSRRGKELSPQDRSRICELHSVNKWGAKRIHRVHPEFPVSTIHSTIRREAIREDNTSKSRPGRPKKLSEADLDHLRHLIRDNSNIKREQLLDEVGHRVERTTLWRLYNELGMPK